MRVITFIVTAAVILVSAPVPRGQAPLGPLWPSGRTPMTKRPLDLSSPVTHAKACRST